MNKDEIKRAGDTELMARARFLDNETKVLQSELAALRREMKRRTRKAKAA